MIRFTEIIIWMAFLVSSYFLIFWLLVFLEEDSEKYSRRTRLRKRPFVSVCIPAYNEEASIRNTVEKTLGLDYPRSRLEVIVVDDGSIDRTAQVVEQLRGKYSNLHLVTQKNKGKGAALNAGLVAAKGEYFVVLDADSYPRKDALQRLLPHFTNDRVATVLPLMKLDEARTLLQKIQWCEYMINFFYKKLMGLVDCIHVAPGPFSVYRKDILQKIGGFDENNLTEDLEISLRLQKYDYRLVQTFDTQVYTSSPTTLKEFYRQRNRWYKGSILNMLKYRGLVFNKKYGDFGMLQAPRVLTAGFLVIALIVISGYNFLLPWARRICDLYYIRFDIMTLLKDITINFHLLDLNYSNIFFALSIFMVGLIFIWLAHSHSGESWIKHGKLTVPAYLLMYSLLVSIVWIGILFDFLRGKIQKW
ncbi:MAG: glycosyltransferase family 2 protein [Candidatus Woesearchaeota archaeon]